LDTDNASIVLAKLAGIRKSLAQLSFGDLSFVQGTQIEPLMPLYEKLIGELKQLKPELFDDLPLVERPKNRDTNGYGTTYDGLVLLPYIQSLDYVLEVWANHRIASRNADDERPQTIFISHGRSSEWLKVQRFIEKDLGFGTIELAQQPNMGRTILQKLKDESERCGVAVIVMTGDDSIGEGETRARENVLHEIGYFQGKYGLDRVVLLHEEGTSIPSNIHGLVYIPFAKAMVEMTYSTLQRELQVVLAA
jgi:hypothetical protein